jgi:hypothetical protein
MLGDKLSPVPILLQDFVAYSLHSEFKACVAAPALPYCNVLSGNAVADQAHEMLLT